jgi:hypothetical protein
MHLPGTRSINVGRRPDGIGHVLTCRTQESDRRAAQTFEHAQMASRHGVNTVGLQDHLGGQRLALMTCQVGAEFPSDGFGLGRRLTAHHRSQAGRLHQKSMFGEFRRQATQFIREQLFAQRFRERAAARIACANEDDPAWSGHLGVTFDHFVAPFCFVPPSTFAASTSR